MASPINFSNQLPVFSYDRFMEYYMFASPSKAAVYRRHICNILRTTSVHQACTLGTCYGMQEMDIQLHGD